MLSISSSSWSVAQVMLAFFVQTHRESVRELKCQMKVCRVQQGISRNQSQIFGSSSLLSASDLVVDADSAFKTPVQSIVAL